LRRAEFVAALERAGCSVAATALWIAFASIADGSKAVSRCACHRTPNCAWPLHFVSTNGGRMIHPVLVAILLSLQPFNLPAATPAAQALMNREQEIDLALKAAPVHLRPDATVFVFSRSGYEKIRTGSNGFNCMVNRDGLQNGDSSVHPTCWDAEGSRTILPIMLRVGELLAQGKSAAGIKQDIEEGFAQGRFHSPAKAGIAYMLAAT
jgi:hypothetical protein